MPLRSGMKFQLCAMYATHGLTFETYFLLKISNLCGQLVNFWVNEICIADDDKLAQNHSTNHPIL